MCVCNQLACQLTCMYYFFIYFFYITFFSFLSALVANKGTINIAILDLSNAISRKRCETEGKLVLITNRKSYDLSIGTKIGDLD